MLATEVEHGEMGAQHPALLRVRNISMQFGGVVALDSVSFDIGHGEICGLIGPNGSGKTTLFNCISGIYRYGNGDILLEGKSLRDMPRHRIASLGIGRTFQNLAVFGSMTVHENVLVGTHGCATAGFLSDALRLPSARQQERACQQKASSLVALLDLHEVEHCPVGELPFAMQKRVELARALASSPKLLLLDEPAGGLSQREVEVLCGLILRIREKFRLTILLVEHHMNLVMRVSDRVVALDFGRKIADGPPDVVQVHPDVIRGYLGGADHAGAP